MHYALCYICEHLSKAEPSDDLREALLNTCYITALIKFETFHSTNIASFNLLAKLLLFLKGSVSIHGLYSVSLTRFTGLQKFTDTEDLYLHHRNIYDRIMRKRIAYVSLDPLGSIVGLALAGLHPNIEPSDFNRYFTHRFPAIEGGLLGIYQSLYFHPWGYRPGSESRSWMMLTEFLTDPGRAGEHALDGPKCALVIRFLLDCFISPCSERNFVE